MSTSTAHKHSSIIKDIALELGFNFCGISKADFLKKEATKLEEWLSRGYHGKMNYLENNFEKRLDPRKLVPGAKSVVSLAYNYFPNKDFVNSDPPKIAKYAYGEDYHHVIKDKLKIFLKRIHDKIGKVGGRAFVDSAPVHERAWAEKSGLGWIGKNSLLLNKKMGSFFFLAELIIDLDLIADRPLTDHCGSCTRCIDACPTDAITEPSVVDASRCVSYLTIELKENIPVEFKDKLENWAFGCDICQDVCPWNRNAKPHQESRFEPQGWEDLSKREWTELTKEVFDKVFKKSAVKRTKFEGLKRNIEFLSK